mgnify:CR=1 FL=1
MRQLDLFEASHEASLNPHVPTGRRDELLQRMADVILAVVNASRAVSLPATPESAAASYEISPEEGRHE